MKIFTSPQPGYLPRPWLTAWPTSFLAITFFLGRVGEKIIWASSSNDPLSRCHFFSTTSTIGPSNPPKNTFLPFGGTNPPGGPRGGPWTSTLFYYTHPTTTTDLPPPPTSFNLLHRPDNTYFPPLTTTWILLTTYTTSIAIMIYRIYIHIYIYTYLYYLS